ncbi:MULTISPECIES: hypothetical protein [Desulfovibrio]|uniref:Radical SAM protein n=1 Tax=Desulfovibrio desulfuricans TaxID=876 RepID=A0AA94L366_DESDE|nr:MULTISPECIES: hypothetical protein [Desulfovibrio]ATD81544.1 hypothetical protein CNY67_09295 [Desulfovibrio sp. G11]SFW66803.1 hypothetical protein SAMN02910291_02400 [Desulfovibrio desulfuricans]SPD34258.1 Aldolase-type TIM barrel [Desulfovibrio sp. G11]
MRQLREMSIIEIDITNACHKQCSNCTRFCGHHRKNFFMDFETFIRAVDSLDGYRGLISTIGGEPLLHPEYHRFATYLLQKRGKPKKADDGRCQALVRDCLGFAKMQRWFEGSVNAGRGFLLFTSMPKNFYSRYEIVQDTVTDLWLNDHTNPSFHQPILISRKDLGIGDAEFARMRANCWLQNFWSASITPKGAFFCEIAGTLDLLFDGPGGKTIEPGWWEKDISEFSDQFHWCDICGMPLKTYSRNANDEVDDASETLYKRLESVQSPKLKAGKVHLFSAATSMSDTPPSLGLDMASVTANYQPYDALRVGNAVQNLKPDGVWLVQPVRTPQELDFARQHMNTLSGIYIVGAANLKNDVERVFPASETIRHIFSDQITANTTLGDILRRALAVCPLQTWLMLADPDLSLPPAFADTVSDYFLNPGYLFVCSFGRGRGLMLSKTASALRQLGEDGLCACRSLEQILMTWGAKVHYLEAGFETLSDFDIPCLREKAYRSYAEDIAFVQRLRQRLEDTSPSGSTLLVTHSAFIFHTLSIARLITEMGYGVHVVSTEKFKEYFFDWLPEEACTYFEQSHFSYQEQQDIRANIKARQQFAGAIVPYSFGPSTVKPIDDYTDALRTAEDIGGTIVGIINIRRQFIELEYNIWQDN